MSTSHNVLISLEERHASRIFEGTKTVELRRRPMHIAIGATVWIYVKMPVGSVVGCAKVTGRHTLDPIILWDRFGVMSGLQRHEFFEYFSGLQKAFALNLSEPTRLASPISLSKLRATSSGFHPPQFFINVASDGALLRAMRQALQLKRATPSCRNQIPEPI